MQHKLLKPNLLKHHTSPEQLTTHYVRWLCTRDIIKSIIVFINRWNVPYYLCCCSNNNKPPTNSKPFHCIQLSINQTTNQSKQPPSSPLNYGYASPIAASATFIQPFSHPSTYVTASFLLSLVNPPPRTCQQRRSLLTCARPTTQPRIHSLTNSFAHLLARSCRQH